MSTPPPPVQSCRDPGDDKFIACALAHDADCLVTEDKDLLVLGDSCGVRIVTPAEFIQQLNRPPA